MPLYKPEPLSMSHKEGLASKTDIYIYIYIRINY